MKKVMFFVLVLFWGAALIAQNKAVAITEVVDKEGKVPYAVEVMVRTKLTSTISMKQGYTAYDRVDLQSIMAEQNFQRTGLVNDSTIKKLGEMTGASLVLIPEVASSDDGKIYVAVKMLDVTTAQTIMTTGQLMGSTSNEVEEGCRILAAKVLGEQTIESNSSTSADEPVTLFGYLHVFPMDIGEFQVLPEQLLSAINKSMQYGYDSWRLPTTEELSIMRVNANLIPNFKNADYLCSDSSNRGYARLVTTKGTVKERQNAIFNILGVTSNFDSFILTEDGVFYITSGYDGSGYNPNNRYFHYIFDPQLLREYIAKYDLFNIVAVRRIFKSSSDVYGFYFKTIVGNYGGNYYYIRSDSTLSEGSTSFYPNDRRYFLYLLKADISEATIQQEMQRLSQQQ